MGGIGLVIAVPTACWLAAVGFVNGKGPPGLSPCAADPLDVLPLEVAGLVGTGGGLLGVGRELPPAVAALLLASSPLTKDSVGEREAAARLRWGGIHG